MSRDPIEKITGGESPMDQENILGIEMRGQRPRLNAHSRIQRTARQEALDTVDASGHPPDLVDIIEEMRREQREEE